MDQNIFFWEATLRICSSLNLRRALSRTLEYFNSILPADGLHIGLYDPDLNLMRNLVHIAPDNWPKVPAVITVPDGAINQLMNDWRSEAKFGVVNDIGEIAPEVKNLVQMIWPADVSILHTDLELEKQRIGKLVIAAEGRHRYHEAHAQLMSQLNEPFSIALANALQHQEALRLKEMLEDDNRYLNEELRHISGDTIIGADFGLKGVMEMIRQVAPLESPVLLLGETGTGKELLANALHSASPRREGAFVKVNCGGLTKSLLDSELFGHEKGAFTGAISQKRGRFERAHGGTIFLDEIGELPHEAQVKLLRVLQYKEIERVGGTSTIPVDVRIISATHRNLEEMVGRGMFRQDLWFRLNVFPIMIPPLRQRPQDMSPLLDHLIHRKCREMKIAKEVYVPAGTLEKMKNYHWPGNVRELQNLVERSLIRAQSYSSKELCLDLTPVGSISSVSNQKNLENEEILPFDDAVTKIILKALEKSNGKIIGTGGAAELLQLHPSTLRGKMRKLNI